MSGQLIPATTWGEVVGRVLIRCRESMTQADMARAVGLSQSVWSKIERGMSALTIDQLELAAIALKTTSEEIMRRARLVAEHLREHGIQVEPTREVAADRVRIGGPALATMIRDVLLADRLGTAVLLHGASGAIEPSNGSS